MWKLSINKTIEDEYQSMILPGLTRRVKVWEGKRNTPLKYGNMRDDLLPDWKKDEPIETTILIQLLTSKPEEAYESNKEA